MRPAPGMAVAMALLLAVLAAAGCGLGAGDRLGQVSLTITRDYGTVPVEPPLRDGVSESDSVMRVLERNAGITTSYGGGFVQSIAGIEGEERLGRPFDWFYYVNGVEGTVGAAEYRLHAGEAIWWDYHDWSAAMRVPAVVGSWPQPFAGGYDGKPHPVVLECLGGGPACGIARERLRQAGVTLAAGTAKGAIRMLVGPWPRVRRDPAAAQLEDGPQQSGVFAEFVSRGGGFALKGLEVDGENGRDFGPGTGLVAATRRYEDPPVWVVTGGDLTGARAAAGMLDAAHLRDRYAIAVEGGEVTALPLSS